MVLELLFLGCLALLMASLNDEADMKAWRNFWIIVAVIMGIGLIINTFTNV